MDESKREAILQILNGPGDSASKLSRLRVIDPNWPKFLENRQKKPKETPKPESGMPREIPEYLSKVRPKPTTMVPTVLATGKQVRVGEGTITRLGKSIGDIEGKDTLRNHRCPEDLYSACLDEAVRRNWPGFSCVNCKNFQ